MEKNETHISVVFLVADKVFKLKRSVKYSYLDFSTLELRRRYCEAEVAINPRTPPDLYKGVVAVRRDEAENFYIGGAGEVANGWLKWSALMKTPCSIIWVRQENYYHP